MLTFQADEGVFPVNIDLLVLVEWLFSSETCKVLSESDMFAVTGK